MTQYWICHNPEHVAKKSDCTSTPYGDSSLYNPTCHPFRLKLVGLKEDTDNNGNLPDQWVCISPSHYGECRTPTTPNRRSVLSQDQSDHIWERYFTPGEYISLVVEVWDDGNGNNSSKIAINTGDNRVYIKRKHILGLADRPLPDEPKKSTLLKSQRESGEIFAHQNGSWHIVGEEGAGFEWADVWNGWGPFELYPSNGAVLK